MQVLPNDQFWGPSSLQFILIIWLNSNLNIFADDTSLFSEIHDVSLLQIDLNEDLDNINNWVCQWKMSFNPDPSKKAQEKVFPRNVKNVFHPNLTSKNVDVGQICSLKFQ